MTAKSLHFLIICFKNDRTYPLNRTIPTAHNERTELVGRIIRTGKNGTPPNAQRHAEQSLRRSIDVNA